MDDFMKQYQSLKDLTPQIRQQLNNKKSTSRDSIAFNKSNVRVKTLLNSFESDLKQLKNEFQRLINTKRYPQIELDRRQELVNEINTLHRQFQQELLSNSSTSQFSANQNRHREDENAESKQYTTDEARDRQMLLLQEQDQGMDMLGEILTKQKFIARDMCEEVTIQNEIIDNINDIMDQADTRLLRNIRNTEKISRKSSTCGIVSDSSGPLSRQKSNYNLPDQDTNADLNYISNNKIDLLSAGGTFNAATSSSSTMIRHLEVPNSVPKGSLVLLHCDFEESNLYTVKWYKNFVEFFRYVPSNPQKPAQEFRLRGVHLDLNLCNISHVYLTKVDLDSEGIYACEVSADGPFFATARMQKQMKVYLLPDADNLKLSSSSHVLYYTRRPGLNDPVVNASLGETMQLTCETGISAPEMQIGWLINEQPAQPNLITQYAPIPVSPESPLLISRSSIQLPLDNGVLFSEPEFIRVKCTAKLNLKYEHRSIEVLSSAVHGNRKYFYISKDWYNGNRDSSPLILFEQNVAQFDVDDFLHVNCSSNLTNSQLKWFINDQEIQSEHLIAYHINNEYPVLLLTMRLEESWFERYNELRLECRAIVYETVANFQRKLLVNVIDSHRRIIPTLTIKGRGSTNIKQTSINGRTYNTGIHVHRTNNRHTDDHRKDGRLIIGNSLTEIVPGTRGSASLTILNPADEPNTVGDLDYHHNQNNRANHQSRSLLSGGSSNNNQQQRPVSTVKRKRKRPTNVNLFNQLDYDGDLYSDGHSVSSDDGENTIEANSLAANRNHCHSAQFVPTTLLLVLVNLILVFTHSLSIYRFNPINY